MDDAGPRPPTSALPSEPLTKGRPPSVIDVAAGLVFRKGKLLITQRRPEDHLGGLWEFPGGKREPDESFEICLKRELSEELGIEVVTAEVLEEIVHTYPEKTVRLKFFRCHWEKHEPRALGCHACAWVALSELDHYAFPAADERLLSKLKNSPELWGDRGGGESRNA